MSTTVQEVLTAETRPQRRDFDAPGLVYLYICMEFILPLTLSYHLGITRNSAKIIYIDLVNLLLTL